MGRSKPKGAAAAPPLAEGADAAPVSAVDSAPPPPVVEPNSVKPRAAKSRRDKAQPAKPAKPQAPKSTTPAAAKSKSPGAKSKAKLHRPTRPIEEARQKRFAEEYVVDFNATQAALRAGYTRGNNAHRLLHRPAVAAAVEKAIAARRKHTLITADRVLKEYARIAFADLRRVSKWGPEGVDLIADHALTDDDAAAIAELSHRKGSSTRIKLHDKRRALDSIARHLGLFTPQQSVADPKARLEAAARARETLARGIAALHQAEAATAPGQAENATGEGGEIGGETGSGGGSESAAGEGGGEKED